LAIGDLLTFCLENPDLKVPANFDGNNILDGNDATWLLTSPIIKMINKRADALSIFDIPILWDMLQVPAIIVSMDLWLA